MVGSTNILQKRLREFLVRTGLTKRELAEKLGISPQYLSEILSGKKNGRRKILDFAERLGFSADYLTDETLFIPLIAEVEAMAPFAHDEKQSLEYIDISKIPGINREIAQNCYALRVRDQSMLPFLKSGDLMIAQRGSHSTIKHGDKVVYYADSLGYVRYIDMDTKATFLRPLNLDSPPETISRNKFRHLDKIIYLIPA